VRSGLASHIGSPRNCCFDYCASKRLSVVYICYVFVGDFVGDLFFCSIIAHGSLKLQAASSFLPNGDDKSLFDIEIHKAWANFKEVSFGQMDSASRQAFPPVPLMHFLARYFQLFPAWLLLCFASRYSWHLGIVQSMH
jgi:hypothetical protein